MNNTKELIFQNKVITRMIERGWVCDKTGGYDRERALYSQDTLAFVQTTQPQEWGRFAKTYPTNTEHHFPDALVAQLKRADINVTDVLSYTYGTLGVSCHGIRSHDARSSLCQLKPEYSLSPETLSRYKQNIYRTVPGLVYSPRASNTAPEEADIRTKKWRIDLVPFVNDLPVATLELKSESKQAV